MSGVRQQVIFGFGIALGIVITAAVFIGAGDRLLKRSSGSREGAPPVATTSPAVTTSPPVP
jgi:hypothetical protein